jgi:hypothetical protein
MFPLPLPMKPPDVLNSSDHSPFWVAGGVLEQEPASTSNIVKTEIKKAGTAGTIRSSGQVCPRENLN